MNLFANLVSENRYFSTNLTTSQIEEKSWCNLTANINNDDNSVVNLMCRNEIRLGKLNLPDEGRYN